MNKQQRQRTKRLIFESLENRWLLAADTLPVELVSTGHPDDPAAAVGNDRSTAQSMSADGRFVAFRSSASNLVAGDSNGVDDVFRKDLVTGELALVSTAKSGEIGNGSSTGLAMSADGRFVAFSSRATNLVSIDRNGSVADIFVKDMQTGKVTLVSETASLQQSSSGALGPAISADGRYVAFVGGPIGDSGAAGIYRKDLRTNRLEFVAEGFTTEVAISGDGNLVLYNVGFVGQLRVRNMTAAKTPWSVLLRMARPPMAARCRDPSAQTAALWRLAVMRPIWSRPMRMGVCWTCSSRTCRPVRCAESATQPTARRRMTGHRGRRSARMAATWPLRAMPAILSREIRTGMERMFLCVIC